MSLVIHVYQGYETTITNNKDDDGPQCNAPME